MAQEYSNTHELRKLYRILFACIILLLCLVAFCLYSALLNPSLLGLNPEQEIIAAAPVDDEYDNTIENGIHIRTGLIEAEGLMTVVNNCTTCHSSKLITQNRMSADRWNETILWMQETQGLWELGNNQKIIVDYLVTNYPQIKKGRRVALKNVDWYELED